MATIQYVVSATDAASGVFAKIAASADGLDKQLADLSKRVATPEVDLKDAKFTLGVVNAAKRLDKLSAMVADPSVEVDAAKAQTEILRITAMLDRLDAKKVEVKVGVDRSLLSRLGGLLGGGGAGAAGGALGIGAAIGPILVGLSQVAGALAAAGAGAAAFGALAIPQFTVVSQSLQQISTDTAAYERATTKASKSLALKHIRQDWADMTVPQRQAVHGIQSLQSEFGKLSAKLAPVTFKVLNDGLKIASRLLPDLLPFARAAGNAIDGLLKSFGKFTQTAGFKAFLAQLQALSGPAITALGQGLGKIAVAVGKLILVSASPNSIKVLSGLLTVMAGTIDVLTFVIGRASGKIVEWKNDFADIGRVVSSWVKNTAAAFTASGHNVAVWAHGTAAAFDTVRHAVAAIGHDIASAFDAVRRTFAGAGHSIANIFDTVRHAQGQFDAFGKDIEFVRHVILAAFDDVRHGGAIAFDALRHAVAAAWDRMWKDAMSVLNGARHDIAAAWDAIWHHSTTQAQSGIASIVHWFKTLPGRALAAMFGLGHQLYAFGHAALSEFWSGLKSVAGGIFSWVKNFVATIWNAVKRFFGIASPSSLFYSAGKNLMLGLFHGIRDHAHHAAAAARSAQRAVSGALGGDALANQALARRIFPWPASQWAPFVSLVMAESGFNRFARNPSSGAYGIAQALPPTKYPFAGQAAGGSHAGAQLSWMFDYIRGRYGTPAAAWAHELAAHWYGSGLYGGVFNRPTLIGVGERGPERVDVTPVGRGRAGGSLVHVEQMVVQDATDVALVASRLNFAIYAASLGS